MKSKVFIGLMVIISFLIADHIHAEIPNISNLHFSVDTASIGDEFTISIEFEGDVDSLFIENTWETTRGEIKKETKEYTIPQDIQEKRKGVIIRKWKIVNPKVKPYRILKIWVKDTAGNQSNSLSGEIKVKIPEIKPEEKNYSHIVVLSDLHLPGRNIPLKEEVIDTIDSWPDVDMIVLLGDICEEFGTVEEYAYAKKFLDQLNKPLYPIVGNHDYLYEDNIPGKHVKASYTIRKKKLQRFKETFSLQEVFYSKRIGGYLLIFLSTDDLHSDNLTEISGKQIDWLQSELSKNKDIPTIIFFHAPLKGTLMGNNKYVGDDKHIAQPNRKIRKIILENAQIFLWISGHYHIAPTNVNFNHKVNIYEQQVVNIHNCDMDGRSNLSEADYGGKGHSNIWTNSLYLYPDKVMVKTYDHKKNRWLEELKREIKPLKVIEPKEESGLRKKESSLIRGTSVRLYPILFSKTVAEAEKRLYPHVGQLRDREIK